MDEFYCECIAVIGFPVDNICIHTMKLSTDLGNVDCVLLGIGCLKEYEFDQQRFEMYILVHIMIRDVTMHVMIWIHHNPC